MFGKNRIDPDAWMKRFELRYYRVASGYNMATGEYTYLTEPVLQYRDEWNTPWRNITTDVELMAKAAK